jgi:hypothetical protein
MYDMTTCRLPRFSSQTAVAGTVCGWLAFGETYHDIRLLLGDAYLGTESSGFQLCV